MDGTPVTLGNHSLAALRQHGASVPTYERSGPVGVVHLGLGAFHRAHQAMVFDQLLRQGDLRWRVLGVGMHSARVADLLAAQDGLYTVQVNGPTTLQWCVPGAVTQTCVASRERPQVVAAIANPQVHWVTLTVTEKAYGPELAQLLAEGLQARFAAGLPGLTLASCDNLSHNGEKLKAICLAATEASPELQHWVAGHCRFPNSMVDRIVPATSAARIDNARAALGVHDESSLGTEAFWEWVIDRHGLLPQDAEALARVGVTLTDDVAPYEDAKLRMLNASHTVMACIGAVLGLPFIRDCVATPAIRELVHGLMTHEVGPQMRRERWPAYRDALLDRFTNPALMHSVHQIATDCSQKIPQRWPASVLGCIQAGQMPERLAFAVAAWMRYCLGQDERGTAYTLNDPQAERMQALAVTYRGDADGTVRALGSLPEIWGAELATHSAWQARLAHHLSTIFRLGMLPALESMNSAVRVQTT